MIQTVTLRAGRQSTLKHRVKMWTIVVQQSKTAAEITV